jgi:hypothetical protein
VRARLMAHDSSSSLNQKSHANSMNFQRERVCSFMQTLEYLRCARFVKSSKASGSSAKFALISKIFHTLKAGRGGKE